MVRLRRGLVRGLGPMVFLAGLGAQAPVFAPTANTTLDGDATQGLFHWSSITIPTGVRVHFTGNYPIVIQCDGDARVDGRLDVDGSGVTSGPGYTSACQGSNGIYSPCSGSSSPGSGNHAGCYGTAVPFDLRGGSPGGGTVVYYMAWPGYCVPAGGSSGGPAGGTLVLEANGRIDIHGAVAANGSGGMYSTGSGGSLLLRGLAGLTVHSTGVVEATTYPPSTYSGFQGIVRLDAYSQLPVVLGRVTPSPTLVQLPYVVEKQPPAIGQTWELNAYAPRGDGVFLAAAFSPGQTTTAYGTVGLDLGVAITFAVVVVPTSGHDPCGVYRMQVPNVAALSGLGIWTAGMDWITPRSPCYSNTVHSVVW